MTSLARIVTALEPVDDGWRGAIPETWLQGRTAYGGMSGALALAVAQRSDTALPPLRSAQVAFVGPLAGTVTIRAQRLRRGRNAAWVQADVEGEAGLGLRATFVFMDERTSRVDYHIGAAPDRAPPGPEARLDAAPAAVAFARNFEIADRSGGTSAAGWLRWMRLRERDGLDPAVELMAVADGLPPAALRLLGGYAPVSSLTWQLDLLGTPVTDDGWWLLHAATDHARAGMSSQRMRAWNARGVPVAEQMQSVALFG